MPHKTLEEYFEFDEYDLNANRQGRLSEKQDARLNKEERASRSQIRMAGYVLAVVTLLLFLLVLYLINYGNTDLLSFLWVVLFGAATFWFLRAGFKKVGYILKKTEGPAYIEQWVDKDDPGTTLYELQVGGVNFGVGPELVRLISQGEVYAVYYCWGTDTVESDLIDWNILSIEKQIVKNGVIQAL
jgi:hypothetical protein